MKIVNWNTLDAKQQDQVLQRPALIANEIAPKVQAIIQQVKTAGDQTLIDLTKKFDQVELSSIMVDRQQFIDAEKNIDQAVLKTIKYAMQRIEYYQQQCLPKEICVDTQDGIICRRIPKAIPAVGLYVPGGSAPLLSTLMMLAIPARVAGCARRIVCTPPNAAGKIDPILLMTAKLCGVHAVYQVGGAQAIAAMAYGTQSIAQVDKIFGPGNAWVTQAKQAVSIDPAAAMIDLPAGPSEVLVIADANADADCVAADLLSQAEHGVDSQALLVTTSQQFAQRVQVSIQVQLALLSRKSIIQAALQYATIIVVDQLAEALTISNRYAAEHVILQVENAQQWVKEIEHAGAIFVGPWAAETLGDYINGANHVLPTYGYARRCSGLSVSDFMKYISVQQVSRQGLQTVGQQAMQLAQIEGLSAHKNAVAVRLQKVEQACV